MSKTDNDRFLEESKDAISDFALIAEMLKALVDNGFYVTTFFDNQTTSYGAAVLVGCVVGDLQKPKNDGRILFKANPGELSSTAIIEQLAVLTNTDLKKKKKG